MAEDGNIEGLFARINAFSLDERKRETNLRVHKIDFVDATRVFDGPALIRRSDRHGEIRYQILGIVKDHEIALVCTIRGENSEECRIISARRARREERRAYYDRLARKSAEGRD